MKAWELLDSREKWTQHAMARKVGGEIVFPNDKRAACWCAMGAIEKCYEHPADQDIALMRILTDPGNVDEEPIYWATVVDWNDSAMTTFEDVQRTLRRLDI